MEIRIRLGVTLAAALLAVGGCSIGSANGSRDLSEGVPPGLLASASEFQQRILSDGEVTFSEYEESVLATVSCLEQADIWVSELVFNSTKETFAFSFGGALTESGGKTIEDTYEACYKEFQDAVDDVWALQNRPSVEEETAFYERVLECMRDKGYDVAIDADSSNLNSVIQDAPDDYGACFNKESRMGG